MWTRPQVYGRNGIFYSSDKLWSYFVDGVVRAPFVDYSFGDEWYFVASVWNGEEIKLFFNGYEVSSEIANEWIPDVRKVFIGAESYQGIHEFFNGEIDDVRIYNIVLNESEINLLYNEESNIDVTPPEISILGIENGGIYTNCVTPDVTITDDDSGISTQSIKLNGEDYVSGTEITENGFYTLKVIATDKANNKSSESINFVVYSPEGQVTGGGWIAENSKKSNFSFIVKYKDSFPKGNLEFQSKESNINLKSKGIDWLVINDNETIFQGTGTIKHLDGKYTFRVNCVDSSKDKFTIRIWQENDTNVEPIYESINMDISGGNIKVK